MHIIIYIYVLQTHNYMYVQCNNTTQLFFFFLTEKLIFSTMVTSEYRTGFGFETGSKVSWQVICRNRVKNKMC